MSGSPPRAWGRRLSCRHGRQAGRFTPTCVGTTSLAGCQSAAASVHPHVRGDDAGRASRARGRRRFTPTCVGTTSVRPRPRPLSPVHPHVRGDDEKAGHTDFKTTGSPPRAWGRPGLVAGSAASVPVHPHVRGDDLALMLRLDGQLVHPHVRGDDHLSPQNICLPLGSPPRAWGRRGHAVRRTPGLRFTPTCVGTTSTAGSRPSSRTVHPHVRGDDGLALPQQIANYGSPPRAWGRPAPGRFACGAYRFTPTCVGTTAFCSSISERLAVHPHVRGDDVRHVLDERLELGSPPRAWGRLEREQVFGQGARFTPTCVGTTSTSPAPAALRTVHPHVRGDDWCARAAHLDQVRFTPTCVGTTARHSQRELKPCAVHPHVRGDDPTEGRLYETPSGSPPRAWGRRPGGAQGVLWSGSPPRAWGRR